MGYSIRSRTICFIFTFLSFLGLAAPSSAITLSLPDLAGDMEVDPWVEPNFGYPGQRECVFAIPENIAEIENMTFVLSGHWHAGEISCDSGFGEPEVSPLLPPISIIITSDNFPGDYFYSSIPMPDDSFDDLTGEFTSSYPPGVLEFNDLLGADLHAELIIDFALVGICSITMDSFGTLDQVELQVTGTVPTEGSSWGDVKSLYR